MWLVSKRRGSLMWDGEGERQKCQFLFAFDYYYYIIIIIVIIINLLAPSWRGADYRLNDKGGGGLGERDHNSCLIYEGRKKKEENKIFLLLCAFV